jgi:hypothetical protein
MCLSPCTKLLELMFPVNIVMLPLRRYLPIDKHAVPRESTILTPMSSINGVRIGAPDQTAYPLNLY